jgi:16S rRNA (uracil1498-N3)-methyltransferase
MRAGDTLVLFDGSGADFTGEIVATGKNEVTISIGEGAPAATESPLRITLWHGICRSSRMDYVVQKATELGVNTIQPLITERSVVRLDAERAASRREHWQKVAISAAEQCGRSRLPHVLPPRSLDDSLAQLRADELAVMLHPGGKEKLSGLLADARHLTLVTGPEGGFTDAECALAVAAGFRLASLGPRVLRSETAPVAALTIAQAVAGDLA